jgi:hypothetical protein
MTPEERRAEFVASAGERDRKQEAQTRKGNLRRTRIKPKSVKQEILDAKWAGIKEAFIFLAHRYEPDGKVHCEECGMAGQASEFDLHHIRRRGQGGEYAARNAALVCRPCHQKLTGEPMWGAS